MKGYRTWFAVLLIVGAGGILRAEDPITMTSARDLFNQSKQERVKEAYAAITTNEPTNSEAWQNPGGKIAPCRSVEYRQFDFWIGDWDVRAPNGSSVGHNLVTLEQDGCLLVEHWTASSGGQTGTSFNYYDVRDKKWHQLYLDNSGNAGAFPAMAGNFVDGKMVLLTNENEKPVSRWTWYLLGPGKVRQMAEQSSDGGKAWKIVWDSVYVKAETAPPTK